MVPVGACLTGTEVSRFGLIPGNRQTLPAVQGPFTRRSRFAGGGGCQRVSPKRSLAGRPFTAEPAERVQPHWVPQHLRIAPVCPISRRDDRTDLDRHMESRICHQGRCARPSLHRPTCRNGPPPTMRLRLQRDRLCSRQSLRGNQHAAQAGCPSATSEANGHTTQPGWQRRV
jgi:hypothetical protein